MDARALIPVALPFRAQLNGFANRARFILLESPPGDTLVTRKGPWVQALSGA